MFPESKGHVFYLLLMSRLNGSDNKLVLLFQSASGSTLINHKIFHQLSSGFIYSEVKNVFILYGCAFRVCVLFSKLLHFTESICYLICYAVTGIYVTLPFQYLRENT